MYGSQRYEKTITPAISIRLPRIAWRKPAIVGSLEPGSVIGCVESLRRETEQFGGAVVVLDAADEVRERVDLWGPVRGLDLMVSVKQQFDPRRLLSPGRFVGGI